MPAPNRPQEPLAQRELRAALALERQRVQAAVAEALEARADAQAAIAAAAVAHEATVAVREQAEASIATAHAAAEDARRAAAEREQSVRLVPAEQRIAALECDLAEARAGLLAERELRLAVTAELSRRLASERAEFARQRAGVA